METLGELELVLLAGLVQKHPSFQSHIAHLRVVARKLSNTGMLVSIEYDEPSVPSDGLNALFSNGEIIEIKKLKKGLAYVIDVTDGRIESIEFMTYGETWDGRFGDYTIRKDNEFEQ